MADGPIRVQIDPDLADLIPGYLVRRRQDVDALRIAVAHGDFDTVRIIGHSIKGSGGGYGFDLLTDLGSLIETAGIGSDPDGASSALATMADYLERLVVIDG